MGEPDQGDRPEWTVTVRSRGQEITLCPDEIGAQLPGWLAEHGISTVASWHPLLVVTLMTNDRRAARVAASAAGIAVRWEAHRAAS